MEKKNKIILAVTAIAVVVVIAIVGIVSSNSKNSSNNISSNTSQSSQSSESSTSKATERPIVKPTFMYFVSQQDEQYQAATEVFAKLQEEFADRVEFDLKVIEEDPTIADNFSLVMGQTPALIMLDIHNDICNFLFATTDETQLRDAITKALGE